jgi:hypothetical protein
MGMGDVRGRCICLDFLETQEGLVSLLLWQTRYHDGRSTTDCVTAVAAVVVLQPSLQDRKSATDRKRK